MATTPLDFSAFLVQSPPLETPTASSLALDYLSAGTGQRAWSGSNTPDDDRPVSSSTFSSSRRQRPPRHSQHTQQRGQGVPTSISPSLSMASFEPAMYGDYPSVATASSAGPMEGLDFGESANGSSSIGNNPPNGKPYRSTSSCTTTSNSSSAPPLPSVAVEAGWDPSLFASHDVQFQLPPFLASSNDNLQTGGVETWNAASGPMTWEGTHTGPSYGDSTMYPGKSSYATPKSYAAPPMAFTHQPLESSPSSATLYSRQQQQQTHLHQKPQYQSRQLQQPEPSHSHPSQQQPRTEPSPLLSTLASIPQGASIPPIGKSMPGLYSTSGFDVLGILSRVASRANPRTTLGPVDFSCSFLVVDVRKYDSPIVYASPTFSQLTGYDAREIVGRNCRFLQSPDGEVVKGSRRKYTDNVAVSHIQRQVSQGKECQASLINYRKGGLPFINLLTIVPITWDTDEIVFHVGFQVDLVESPNAILRNIRDGTYQVNYAVLNHPAPPLAPAGQLEPAPPTAVTVARHKGVLSTDQFAILGPHRAPDDAGPEQLTTEWYKLLFEHADDFVLVLSLKGHFQYVSPSVRRVLEYEPEELASKSIADICHPSDVVPIMRELKESTIRQPAPPSRAVGADGKPELKSIPRTVNFLFRVQRKMSGMVWLECTGRLHVEPGKGRKAIILTGRERVLPRLAWSTVGSLGGVEPSSREQWCALSFEGLILYASRSARAILIGEKQQDADLVGSSFLGRVPDDMPPPGSPPGTGSTHARIKRALEAAAAGLPRRSGTVVRHRIMLPAAGSFSLGSSSSSSSQSSLAGSTTIYEVETVFYAVNRRRRSGLETSGPPGGKNGYTATGIGGSQGDSDASSDEGGASDTSSDAEACLLEPELGQGPSRRKLGPTSLLVQIKLVSSPSSSSLLPVAGAASTTEPPPFKRSLTSAAHRASLAPGRETVHAPRSDVFEDLAVTRGTGWQFELHQLKNDNKKLRDQIRRLRGQAQAAAGGGKGKEAATPVVMAEKGPPSGSSGSQQNPKRKRSSLASTFVSASTPTTGLTTTTPAKAQTAGFLPPPALPRMASSATASASQQATYYAAHAPPAQQPSAAAMYQQPHRQSSSASSTLTAVSSGSTPSSTAPAWGQSQQQQPSPAILAQRHHSQQQEQQEAAAAQQQQQQQQQQPNYVQYSAWIREQHRARQNQGTLGGGGAAGGGGQ